MLKANPVSLVAVWTLSLIVSIAIVGGLHLATTVAFVLATILLIGPAFLMIWAAQNAVAKHVKAEYPSKWEDYSGVHGLRKKKDVLVELDKLGGNSLRKVNSNYERVSRLAVVLAFISMPIVLLITAFFSN